VGFDDQRIAGIYDPRLTTIHLPIIDLGYNAMVKLARILAGEDYERRPGSQHRPRAAQHDHFAPPKSLNCDSGP